MISFIMPSLIPGYEYDIFISYRHNDNKSGWVTEFVKNLQEELAATIKEPVSVYFDSNPHDGLLETHDVDDSVKHKLNNVILIPIISQTYCDPKSFAWRSEFLPFKKFASEDKLGLKVRLGNGNVVSRILPVRIHDLDPHDKAFLENEIGPLRSVDFIFRSPGVNRPLNPYENHPQDNLNKTYYRDEINKVANAVKEIVSALRNFEHGIAKKGLNDSYSISKRVTDDFFSESNAKQRSIAVLPFVNMSNDQEQEYFCDGLAEELINALTRIKNVRVVARTSAFSFKGKEIDIREIGQKLGVENILEGSVRRTGNHLRIMAQLINASDGCHIWSERYECDLTDIFAIQDEIALKILEKLRIDLVGQEKSLILKRHTEDVEAHAFYLKGRYFSWLFTEEGFKKSQHYFNLAVEKDPDYALAYAGLADLYCIISIFGMVHPEESQGKARFFAEKTISLDETLAEAHLSLAFVKMFADWNWVGAYKEFKHALELGPGSSTIHLNYSIYPMTIGKSEEAISAARRAVDLDPISPTANQNLGFILWSSGRFDESLEQLKKALELNPGHAWAQLEVGWNYAFKKMFPEAIAACEEAKTLQPEFEPWFHTSIACIFAMAGEKSYTLETLAELNDVSKKTYIDPWNFAVLYGWLGDYESSVQWLEKACSEHSGLCYFVKACSALWLKPISADPRYTSVLRKMGLLPEESLVK